MNIQTERLENHTARITVEIEPKQWEQAKKDAAREISKQIRVKGFRQGKAPYRMVVRAVGEAPIIEEAMENLGNDVYREVITNAEFEPYAAGNLEDFKVDPQPTYVFTVPIQPEIDLGDYREVRVDYEKPEVTEEDVDKAMRQYQQQQAEVEDSEDPVKAGDRVTIDIESEFADGEEPSEDDAEDAEDNDDDDDTPKKGDTFIHQHGATVNLDPEDEPVLPGFIAALVGANKDETVEFELTVPEDDNYREAVRGRKVQFQVTVQEVKSVTLPDLTDELAANITEEEDEPLTLAELRERTREQLQEQAERQADQAYTDEVLTKIVEGATMKYPEVMVVERIHDMIGNLENELKQQGMDLETYQRVMGVTHEDLHEQYEDDATASLERSLVLGEVLVQEGVEVTANDVAAEINKTLAQFGDQSEIFREYFDTEEQRSMIANNILFERVMERLAKIGKGEPLDEPEVAEDDSDEATEEAQEPVATVVEEAQDAVEEELENSETTAEESEGEASDEEESSDEISEDAVDDETD